MAAKVRYELVPPYHAFQFTLPDYRPDDGTLVSGEVCRIEEAGYETDDPQVMTELDLQAHAVRRADKPKGAR